MFTGEGQMETGTSRVPYFKGRLPQVHLDILKDGIVILDRCVAAARAHPGDPKDKMNNASLDSMLGFGLLAMSEARAAMLLISIGFERSARIHLRSLYEYHFRASLMEDKDTARAFRLAAASEAKKYLERMERDASDVAAAEAWFLGDAGAGEASQSEKKSLGGDMFTLLLNSSGSAREYASMFGFPSLFSHGSILALYEVSQATKGRKEDFADAVFQDGLGQLGLVNAAVHVMQLALLLIKTFGINILADWDACNDRLQLIAEKI